MLAEIIKEDLIFSEICSTSKEEALRTMVNRVARECEEVGGETLFSTIMERERLSSTGIGSGIAIPHARVSGLKGHVGVFGRSREGIPFDAIDAKPVHLIFLILGPAGANEVHLKILARISKFLHDSTFRDKLMSVEGATGIYQTISEKDAQY